MTVLSSVKPRAKIGSGCAFVRPASSIHFAEPQSDCSQQAGLERRGRAPRRGLAVAVPHAHLPHGAAGARAAGHRRRRRRTALSDATLPDCHRYGPDGELRLRGRDADLVRGLHGGAPGAAELPAEVRRAVADAERLRQPVRLELARAQRGLGCGRRGPQGSRCYGSQARHRDGPDGPSRSVLHDHFLSSLGVTRSKSISERLYVPMLTASRPGKSLGTDPRSRSTQGSGP